MECAALRAAGAHAADVNRTRSAGDPVELIRLPPCSSNEFTVIEGEATALIPLSLSILVALPCAIQLSLGGFH